MDRVVMVVVVGWGTEDINLLVCEVYTGTYVRSNIQLVLVNVVVYGVVGHLTPCDTRPHYHNVKNKYGQKVYADLHHIWTR